MTDTLFDQHDGRTHANDPWTSRHAARVVSIRSGTLRRCALVALASAGENGLTDFELAERIRARPTSAGTRRKELEEAGYVTRTTDTRPTPYGNPALVHRITAAGFAALREDTTT